MKILITGGAGFIGSAVIRYLINETQHKVFNLDKLNYAGNLNSLSSVSKSLRYKFTKGDICDHKLVSKIFKDFKPDAVMHLAAESHVDRSIDSPSTFIKSNIVGTSVMLECSLQYWKNNFNKNNRFIFHHISTDEVYGSLGKSGKFTEKTSYDPNSPYSASKASSDHLVRAWHRTYSLPVVITNCSNNYGPFQFPEKLIPLTILNALEGKPLPIYGNGKQIRDWLYVDDHAKALYKVIIEGEAGHTYNIGGNSEKKNIDVVSLICDVLDDLRPIKPNGIVSFKKLINFVKDRPGHDQRYAIDISKIKKKINWAPSLTFEKGIKKTINWYIENPKWCKQINKSFFRDQRLGLIDKKNDI